VGRYLAGLLIPPVSGFPLATLFVNITGSFMIGFYATLTGPDGRWFARVEHRQFAMTGVCGGYTTFSAFSLETVRLLQAGMTGTALANIAVSVVTWLVAVWLGFAAANRLNRLKGSK
jgi:CrcB protein